MHESEAKAEEEESQINLKRERFFVGDNGILEIFEDEDILALEATGSDMADSEPNVSFLFISSESVRNPPER